MNEHEKEDDTWSMPFGPKKKDEYRKRSLRKWGQISRYDKRYDLAPTQVER